MAEVKVNIILDATMLDTFQSCPMKFRYRFKENKVTLVKAKPLDRGTLVHSGLEGYFKFLKNDSNWPAAMDALKTSVLAASHESDLAVEEINRAYEVLVESCQINKNRDMRFEILDVESSFSYLLHEDENIRIIMMGKIDLLVNFDSYRNLPIDHKTYERDFPLRRRTNQFCNYANAVNSNYLFVNRIGFQTSIKPEVKHKFVPLSYDPTFLAQWKNNVISWCYDYLECESTGIFPMNDTSCDKYMRMCEYNEVCDTSGEEGKVWKLNTNFNSADPWDVGAVLGKSNAKD